MPAVERVGPFCSWGLLVVCLAGCHTGAHHGRGLSAGPPFDRPFPLGQISDAFWESQQSDAEASDLIFYDHEFTGQTAELAPGGRRKLAQVALRLEHVPFPVVIEQTPPHRADPELDEARRRTVIEQLGRLGIQHPEHRVVIATALAAGITAVEGEQAYYTTLETNFQTGGGIARRFAGRGGFFR